MAGARGLPSTAGTAGGARGVSLEVPADTYFFPVKDEAFSDAEGLLNPIVEASQMQRYVWIQ